jgi:hypothetical protein
MKYGFQLSNDNNGDLSIASTTAGSVTEGDYVLSNGTTVVWDYTTNGLTYYNDVFGIVRDDNQLLYQATSTAYATSSLVTLLSPSSLSDQDALFLGHNNATATAWTTTGAPAGYQIIPRNWKAQETNDVGTVTLTINGRNSELRLPIINSNDGIMYLVVDDDGSATFSDETPIAMYDDGTNGDVRANDRIYTVPSITLNNNYYFTIAAKTPSAPGAISTGLKGWWKADEGVKGDWVGINDATSTIAVSDGWINGVTGPANSVVIHGQSFTATKTGSFNTFAYRGNGATPAAYVQIYICSNAASETLTTCKANPDYTEASIYVPAAESTGDFQVSFTTPFPVTSGSQYIVVTDIMSTDNSLGIPLLGFEGGANGDNYIGGRSYSESDGTFNSSNDDFSFIVGTSNVRRWLDQSGNNNTISNLYDTSTQDAPFTPIFNSTSTATSINFNPVVDFDGSQDRLIDANGLLASSTSITDLHAYVVVSSDRLTGTNTVVFDQDLTSSSDDFNFFFEASEQHQNQGHGFVTQADIATAGTALSTPYIFTIVASNTGGNEQSIFRNGKQLAVEANNTSVTTGFVPQPFGLGGASTGGSTFDGRIAEMIFYTADHTVAQKNRIQSYLAMKYGITIDQTSGTSYTSSDGSTLMWNHTVASNVYNQDITIIGKDTGSKLVQPKSKSQNTDGVVTIYTTDTDIANVTTSTDDKKFFAIGNDGGAATWTPDNMPTGYERLVRKWEAQETNGDIGTVTYYLDTADADFNVPTAAGTGDIYMVFDENANQTFTDEVVGTGILLMYDDGTNGDVTANDDIWTVTADIDNNEQFTFAQQPLGPGGISNGLTLWLDASDIDTDGDAGNDPADGTVVQTWADRSPDGRDFVKSNALASADLVTYQTDSANQMNNRPTVRYDSGASALVLNAAASVEVADGIAYFVYKTSDTSGYLMGNSNGYVNGGSTIDDAWGSNNDLMTHGASSGIYYDFYDNPSGAWRSTTNITATENEPVIVSFEKSLASVTFTAREWKTQNGTGLKEQTVAFGGAADRDLGIGTLFHALDTANIAEVLYYNTPKTQSERQQVESYLAAKYGFTMEDSGGNPMDFIASDASTKMWDSTVSATHVNRVAVIGQDTTGSFLQTTSDTNDTNDAILTISNPTDLDDLEFVSWADNNAQKVAATTLDIPDGFQGALARTWVVQRNNASTTATSGSLDLAFDLTLQSALATTSAPAQYRLLIDPTGAGDFSASTTIISAVNPTVVSGVVTFAGVPDSELTDGSAVMIAQPGAILTYPIVSPLLYPEFNEAVANDGTIADSPMLVTLDNDTFVSSVLDNTNFTLSTHYQINGSIPAGLALDIEKASSTAANILLTGTSTSHANINDTSFEIQWLDAAFSSTTFAVNVVNSTTTVYIDFNDPDHIDVEFATSTGASTDETTEDNFAQIRVNGQLQSTSTIDVYVTGGTATGFGADYLFGAGNSVTLTIVPGTYDGVSGGSIFDVTLPTLTDDVAVEGDETIIFGLQNPSSQVSIEDANLDAATTTVFTYEITDDDASGISGTVYTDDGNTYATSTPKVRLLVNGVDSGISTTTNAIGFFELDPIDDGTYNAGDILTVYIDDETENGVVVTKGLTDDENISDTDIYIGYLRIMNEQATSTISNADLAIADNGEATHGGTVPSATDISDVYTISGSDITVAGGISINSGDTYVPGGLITLTGNFTNNGTFTGTGSSVTFNGTSTAQYLKTNGSSMPNIVNSNPIGTYQTDDLTFLASGGMLNNDQAWWFLDGNDFVYTGVVAFLNGTTAASSSAHFVLKGNETVTLTLGNDTDSGTWRYDGDGVANPSIRTIKDWGATDYFGLEVDDNDAVNTDTFVLGAALSVAGDLSVFDGKLDTDTSYALTVAGDVNIGTATYDGTLRLRSSAVTVGGTWDRNTAGVFTADSSTVTFNGTTDQNILGSNSWYNLALVANGAPRTLGLEELVTQTVGGEFDADFASGQAGTIRSVASTTGLVTSGNLHTINVTGTFGTLEYVDVRDSVLQENGVNVFPEYDPANSTNSGNTFGWFSTVGPGGVSTNLVAWYSASTDVYNDSGTTLATNGQTVEQWSDLSALGNDSQQTTAGNKPTFVTNAINFNSAVNFDGTDDRLPLLTLTSFPTGANPVQSFAVASSDDADNTVQSIFSFGTENAFQRYSTQQETGFHAATNIYGQSALSSGAEFTGVAPVLIGGTYTGTNAVVYSFGQLKATSTPVTANFTNTQGTIGDTNFAGVENWDGNIGEVAIYASNLTALETQRVNTYLALKYGLTLTTDNDADTTLGEVISGSITEGDYVFADATTTAWDYSANSAYHNDITGIVRDDGGGQSGQWQSKSVNTDSIVTLSLGVDPASTTAFSATSQSVVIGNDNASAAWASDSDTNDLDDAPTGYRVLNRVWKAQKTGSVATTTLEFDVADADFDVPALVSGTAYNLIVDTDNDGDFSDETPIVMSDDGATLGDQTAADGVWTYNGVNFTTGQRFTLATIVTTPTISGTVYLNNSTTTYAVADTVRVLINGVSEGTGSINTLTGAYSVNVATLPADGAIITAYIDGSATDAVTVSLHDGVTNFLTGVNLYVDTLTIASASTSAVTDTMIGNGHDGDTDITSIYASSTTLTIASGKDMRIESGDTFAPANPVTVGDDAVVNGTFTLGNAVTIGDDYANNGTTTASTFTMNIGGDFTNAAAGVWSAGTGLVVFNGTAPQAITSSGDAFNNVQNSASTTVVSLVDTISIGGNLTIDTGSVLALSGQNITVTGTLNNDGTVRVQDGETTTLTQDIDSGTWEYVGNGTGSQLLTIIKDFGATDYYNLVINDASVSNSDVFELGSAITTANDFTVTDGEFRGSTFTLTIGGDYTRGTAGTFTANTGTVVFSATSTAHAISGSTTFYNVTLTETNDALDSGLTFENAMTMTVGNNLLLDGLDTDDRINITSTSTGIINVLGGSSKVTADFLEVASSTLQYNGITASPANNPANSIQGNLNTLGWFPVPSIAGIVYQADGVTPYTTPDTVTVLVNGVSGGSAAIAVDGSYEVPLASTPAAEDIITVFIDGSAVDGVTVTRHDSSTTLSGINIVIDALTVRSETVTALTEANLNTAHDGDADITSIFADSSTITVASNKDFYLNVGDSFSPANALTIGGDAQIWGTLSPSNTVTTTGDFNLATTSAVYTSGGVTTVGDDLTNYGTYTAGATNLFVAGDFNNTSAATYTAGTGYVYWNGSASQQITTSGDALYYVENQNTSAVVTYTDDVTAYGYYILTNAISYFEGNSVTFTNSFSNLGTMRIDGDNPTLSFTQDIDSGTFEYVGNGVATALLTTIKDFGATDYYNLVINDASVSNSDVFELGSAITTENDFTLTDGEFRGSTQTLTIGGDYSKASAGTFTANTGTVVFSATSTAHALSGSTTFYNVSFTETNDAFDGGLDFQNAMTMTVGNNLVLDGLDADDRINISATSTGIINVLGGSSKITADFLEVASSTLQYNGVTAAPVFNPANSIDGGNALGWFPTPSIAGIVYQADGITPYTTTDTVRVLINGVSAGTATISGVTGAYEVALSSTPAAEDIITIYIDGGAALAVAVTRHSGSITLTGVDLVVDALTVRTETATALTDADLNAANDGIETDITGIYADGATLTTAAGKDLIVNTGDTFAPTGAVVIGGDATIYGTASTTSTFTTTGNLTLASTTSAFLVGGTVVVGDDFTNVGTYTAGATTLQVAGDFTNSALGTFTPGTGAVQFTGTAAQIVTTNGDALNNVENKNTTAAVTLASALSVSGTYNNDDAAVLALNGNNLSVTGAFTNGDTVGDTTATIRMIGTETVTLTAGQDIDSGSFEFVGNGTGTALLTNIPDFGATDYFNLVINDTAGTNSDIFQFTTPITAANDITVTDGELRAGSQTVTVGGDWVDSVAGIFTPETSTVVFTTGVVHAVSGAPTFYNLSVIETDDATSTMLTFADGETTTINGTLTLDGFDATDKVIVNANPGTIAAVLNVLGGASSVVADFLTLTDSTLQYNGVTASPVYNPANSTNSGNNLGWFPTISISGTLYTDEGTTIYSAATTTISVLINGVATSSAVHSTTTGAYTVVLSGQPAAEDIITVFVDDASVDAVTVTRHNGSVALTGIDLYIDHTVVRSESGTAMTAGNLNTGNNGDSDIISLYQDGVASLAILAGKQAYVATSTILNSDVGGVGSAEFTIAGVLTTSGLSFFGGDLVIKAGGSFTPGTPDVYVNGDVTNLGTYTHNNADFHFLGSGTANFGSSPVYDFTVDSGTVTLAGTLTVQNDLTIEDGQTFALNGNTVSVTGDFNNGTTNGNDTATLRLFGTETITLTGGQDINSGTFEYVGNGTGSSLNTIVKDFGATDYYNLRFNDVSVSNSDIFELGSAITTANDVTVTDGEFRGSTQTLTVGGDFTRGASGVFTANTSTVTFASTTNIHAISGSTTFYNVSIAEDNDASDAVLTFLDGETMTVNNTLTLDGFDSTDTVNITSSPGAVAAIINVVGGSSKLTADFVDVTDNTLQYAGVTASPVPNPTGGVDSGNTSGWFGVTVELSTAAAASTDETAGAATNFPTLFVKGIVGTATTIELANLFTGTATATGTDYTFAANETITIPIGTYDGTIATDIAIVGPTIAADVIAEGPETVNFTLTTPGANVTIGDASLDSITVSTTTYTITDDDDAIVEFSTATAASTNEATANNFPVLLVKGYVASASTIVLTDLQTGTATTSSPLDYFITSPITVNIPSGSYDGTVGTAITLSIPALNQDVIVEGNETINFSLSSPVGDVSLGDANSDLATTSAHTYTITDDDASGLVIQFASSTYAVTEAGVTLTAQLIVSNASTTSSLPETVFIQTTAGTAVGGIDYTTISASTTIPAANYNTPAYVNVVIPITDDRFLEGNETLTATITAVGDENGFGSVIGGQDDTVVTITDDETASIALSSASQNTAGDENATTTLNAVLTLTSTTGIPGIATGNTVVATVTYNTNSTATTSSDITFTSPQTITFTDTAVNGATSSVSYTLNDDSVIEGSELAIFDLTEGAGTLNSAPLVTLGAPAQHTLTINDDDALLVEFVNTTDSDGEGSGGNLPAIYISGANTTLTGIQTVAVTKTGGTATAGTDYAFPTNPITIVIPAADYSAGVTITVPGLAIFDDIAVESSETIIFGFGATSTGVTLGDADNDATNASTTTYTITDDDSATLTYLGSTFIEAAALDGSIGNTIDVEITGDTFSTIGSLLAASSTYYTVTNLPSGLLLDVTVAASATSAVVTLTGAAGSHLNANDVANLQITWLDAAFTGNDASIIANSDKDDFVIDFGDAAITYTGTGFTETGTNLGAVTGSIIATLAGGGTFQDTDADNILDITSEFTLTNVPAGLTPTITLSAGDTVATLTLSTGNATDHEDINDVTDIVFTFNNAAFTSNNASVVAGATAASSGLGVDFENATGGSPFLNYSTATWNEDDANDGTITETITVTLSDDEFTLVGALTASTTYFTTNIETVAPGLHLAITTTSSTTATVSITGTADDHVDANDIANLSITWLDAAFDSGSAAAITNYTKSNFIIDFDDPAATGALTFGTTAFTEATGNLGAITATSSIVLTGDTFVAGPFVYGTHYTAVGLPTGLTAVVTRTSATTSVLSFTGNATTHASTSDATTTISFLTAAFTTSNANDVAGNGQLLTLDFTDSAGTLTYSTSTFTESSLNNGAIASTTTATLTGATFSVLGGTLTNVTHYTITNLPAGLTAVLTTDAGGTNLVVTLTGSATAHANAQDVANLQIAFTDAAFTGALASSVTNSTKSDFIINFADGAPTNISISATSVGTEAGPDPVVFTISLDDPAAVDVTFDIDLTDITANAGSDYTDNSTSLTILAGNTSVTHAVTVINNGGVTNEELLATISNVSGGLSIDQATATGTIINVASLDTDNDSVEDVTEENLSFNSDGDINSDGTQDALQPLIASLDDSGTLQNRDLGIEVSGAGCSRLTDLSSDTEASNGTTDASYDYPAGFASFEVTGCTTGGTISIDAYFGGVSSTAGLVLRKFIGGSYVTISNATFVATTINGIATVIATYEVTDNGAFDANPAAGVIADPIGLGVTAVNFTSSSQSVAESAGAVTVTASIPAAIASHVTVTYALSGSANSGSDYTDTSALTISIPAGMTSGSATITVIDDSSDESNETVVLTIGAVTNAAAGTTNVHTITITDNDSSSSSGGGGGGGGSSKVCNDPLAINYKVAKKPKYVDNTKCKYATVVTPVPVNNNNLSCVAGVYLTKPVQFGAANNPEDVKLLEKFLNTYEAANVPVDGFYSATDMQAVIKWQEKYPTDILAPWGLTKGTGYVYTASLKKIKQIHDAQCALLPLTPATPGIPTSIVPVFYPVTQPSGGGSNQALFCANPEVVTQAIQLGSANNPAQVTILEKFLNAHENANLIVNGIYEQVDYNAVVKWQEKYASVVLTPGGLSKGTGYFFNASMAAMKTQVGNMCSPTAPVFPALPVVTPVAPVVAVAPVNSLSCPIFNTPLELGSQGEEVKKMQAFLSEFLGTDLPATGLFNTVTETAVKDFQAKYYEEILTAAGVSLPTGKWFASTRKQANKVMGCL